MLLIAFGTRPEWIKIKPLIDKIPNQIKYKLLYIRQHNDLIDEFITNYNPMCLDIDNSINRLDSIISSILNKINPIFENVTRTLIQGDTTSALGVALSSFHRKIPVIHLEAGLRSGDINHPYPEEFNRIAISNIASIHLCPTQENLNNIKSNYSGEAYLVGNTVLDNLKNIKPTLGNQVLITLHRRENLNIIKEWFIAIENIAAQNKNLEFIFPMHPNNKIQKYKYVFKNVKVVKPFSYEKCIDMIAKCGMLITDSGGIQEESAFLQKKSIVCRTTTERKEGIGTFSTLCQCPKDLYKIFKNTKIEIVNKSCPYGDGNSCDKILNILKQKKLHPES